MLTYLVYYNLDTGVVDTVSIEAVVVLQILLLTLAVVAFATLPVFVSYMVLLGQIALVNGYLICYNNYTLSRRGYSYLGSAKCWSAKHAVSVCKLKMGI